MKKFLSLMLTFAIISVLIITPTKTKAADSLNIDYVEGDTLLASFDASNADDLASAFVDNGGTVETFKSRGNTYAYASGSLFLEIPIPMCPTLSDNLYIKFTTHAMTDDVNNKSTYFCFADSKRIPLSLTESLYQAANSSLTLTKAGPGMDNIYKVSSSGDYTLYARQVGSTGPWTEITKGQTSAHSYKKFFRIQKGLGINSVIVYKKLSPELNAINTAKNINTMKSVLTTYATELGIDLSKLDKIEDDNAVYSAMIGIYDTKEEVVSAYKAAIMNATPCIIENAVCNENDYTYTVSNTGINAVATITGYTGSDACILLPNSLGGYPVRSIAASAFSEKTLLKGVFIPDNITTIGGKAFYNCDDLEKIEFPRELTSISDYMFYNCDKLNEVKIGDYVNRIGKSAFYECKSLKEINLPERLTSIGAHAFGKSGLKHIDASNVTSYGTTLIITGSGEPDEYTSSAFANCVNLESAVLSPNLATVPMEIFENCTSLKSVTIPSSVTMIDKYAFSGCTSLKEVHIESIADWCKIDFTCPFWYSNAWMTNTLYRFSAETNPLHNGANLYINGSAVTDIEIPYGTTKINNIAFYGSGITSVTIPTTVASIGINAFANCKNLTKATFFTNEIVKNIETEYVSNKLSSGEKIYTEAPAFENSASCVFYCDPATSVGDYARAYNIPIVDKDEPSSLMQKNYTVNTTISSDTRNVYLVANYAFDQSKNIVPTDIRFTVPIDYTFDNSDVTVNGVSVAATTNSSNGQLIVPITDTQGSVKFRITPQKLAQLSTSAIITYVEDGLNTKSESLGIINTDAPAFLKFINYDKTKKNAIIVSDANYSNTSAIIVGYKEGRQISVNTQTKNISKGENIITFEDFDYGKADTIKLMIWEKSSSQKPLFDFYEECLI